MKVLLVDDEFLIIKLLTRIIDWEALNLEIVGYALNATDAMTQIRTLEPDIVITDICMPGGDGLTLIKDILEQYPSMKFIIISGYDNFKYAKTAMKYGIREYILKPIDAKELTTALSNICMQVKKTSQMNLSVMKLAHSFHQLKSKSRSRFIPEVLDHNLTLDVDEVNQDYCTSFASGEYLFCLFHLDFPSGYEAQATQNYLTEISYSQLAELQSACNDFIFHPDNRNIWGFLNYPARNRNEVLQHLTNYSDELAQHFANFTDSRLTLSYGKPVDNFEDINVSLDTCILAFRSRVVNRTSNVLAWCEAMQPTDQVNSLVDSIEMHTFVKSINIGAFEAAVLQIKRFFLLLKNRYYNQAECFYLLSEKIFDCFWQELQQLFSDGSPDKKQFKKSLMECGCVDEIEACVLKHTVFHLTNNLNISEFSQYAPIVLIKNYLQKHYQETISLEDISKLVYLSPSYLSSKFKSETGFSFTTYLTNYRIGKAKQLLQTTNLPIAEIALKVGIPDAKYFTKLFKKNVGVPPSVYRNRLITLKNPLRQTGGEKNQ